MEEESVKAEMRLYVIEYLLASLWAMTALQTHDPSGFWDKTHTQMLAGAQKKTFPNTDAATSDLFSGELEDALSRLSSMVSAQINVVLEAQKKSH